MIHFNVTPRRVAMTAISVLSLSALAMPTTTSADDGGDVKVVKLRDNCDPATFNAAIGDGTCVAHGTRRTVTFAQFLAKLNPADFGHPKWENDPDELDLHTGDSIKAVVRGGEFHTFTEVTEFGAGCVPPINAALGLTNPPSDAQCGEYFATSGVPVGGSLTIDGLSPGPHLFMCVIHPWMRTTVDVENDD
jgi:plastocyanin